MTKQFGRRKALVQWAIISLIIIIGSFLAVLEPQRWQFWGGVVLIAVSVAILIYSIRMLDHEQEH